MRNVMNLNLDWKFYLGDAAGADYMGFDDRAWRNVTIPHDWSIEHPFDSKNASGTGYLPGGTAWYRKSFTLNETMQCKRAYLSFAGVYKHSRVYINSNYLGFHASGYASFSYDVTPFLRQGENVIAVRVEHEEIADSRWFTGSGIYRDVNLTITSECAFTQHGVFVYTLDESTIQVEYETTAGEEVLFSVIDASGEKRGEAAADKPAGCVKIAIEDARLWSPQSPALYILEACVKKNGETTDTVSIPFGIRTVRMDPDKGFFLNGENIKLQGVCVHHDAGALGAAVPKDVWRRRLKKLKAAGCNAIRSAHNPPVSHLLDLCDEMGFLVMDEAFDEWEGAKNKWWQGHNVYPPKRFGYAEDFPQWHEQDLKSMVLTDRNHPSIVLWSIGNEIDYPNDPYVSPLFEEVMGNNDLNKPAAERRYDDKKPDAARLSIIARELVGIVRSLDNTRPVTSALAFPELSNRTGYAQALDVVGYNYKEHLYAQDHIDYPNHVIYGSENSHSVDAWRAVKDNDFICGQFLWTGIDFLGEAKGWPVRISEAGMLTTAGYEKPLYYQRKALWTKEPFVKIAVGHGHGPWDERFFWKGEEGEPLNISVYTNCPEAELFLNGKSLGTKPAGLENGCCARFEAPFAAGTLTARAGDASDEIATPGVCEAISLSGDKDVLKADGQDLWQVEIALKDGEGRLTDSEEPISVQLTGDAHLMGLENGCPDDLTPYSETARKVRGGKLIAYVRAGRSEDEITLWARMPGGIRAKLSIQQR